MVVRVSHAPHSYFPGSCLCERRICVRSCIVRQCWIDRTRPRLAKAVEVDV